MPSPGGRLSRTVRAAALSSAFALIVLATFGSAGHPRDEFLETGSDWTMAFAQSLAQYSNWLVAHHLATEATLFDSLAERINALAYAIAAPASSPDFGLAQRLTVAFSFALLRISFVVVASLRPALFLVIVASVWARLHLRPHRGADILGQTENGRLFFSGIHLGLGPTVSKGFPESQIIGLACPARAPRRRVVRSELAACLRAFGAQNAINLELVSVILAARSTPAYIAPPGEGEQLAAAGPVENLPAASLALLRAALQAYADLDANLPRVAPHGASPALIRDTFEQQLHTVFQRVLSDSARKDLLTLTRAQVATALLAIQAGKVLFHAFEGDTWVQKSPFGQLSARAVLHALPSLVKDYSSAERAVIRQAIVYGLRRSVFAPVKLPLDMPGRTHALRQWVECSLACPHELGTVANEVELFGLVREHEERFRNALSERLQTTHVGLSETCFTTGRVAFVPAQLLCSIARDVLPDEQSVRITMLAERSAAHVRELTTDHGLSVEDAFLWAGLKTVLTSHGWLARRVGDYAVPDQAVIFAIFVDGKTRHGSPGMVALRASCLEQMLGQQWSKGFTAIARATMAGTPTEFERRLKADDPMTPLDEVPSGQDL